MAALPPVNVPGIITVLNTPFTKSDAIDLDGLTRNVAYAVEAGVAGFLVNGLAGEVGELSQRDRDAVATIVFATASKLPVIGGLGSLAGAESRDAAARYLAMGCHGLLLNGDGLNEDELRSTLLVLDALKPPILMLQDWDATGPGIAVDSLFRLVGQVPSLNWLKIEVVPAGPKYSEILARAPERLRVAGGWAVMQMIEALDRGVHAIMPTALHRTYVRICALHAAGRRDEARALFDRVLPILAFSNQRLDISVAFFKRLLHAQGYFATDRCRMPGAGLDVHQRRVADELIELAIALESEALPSGTAAG